MRPLTYYIGVTLDGYIAGPDDQIDFYPQAQDHIAHMNAEYPEVLPTHIRRHMGIDDAPNRRFDTVVMGRRTLEPALAIGITSPYAHLRQVVVSRTLAQAPDPAVQVVSDPLRTVRELKAEDTELGIYLAGGGQLASALLGEIDELVVKVYPVLVGAGIPAAAGSFDPQQFELTDSRAFSNGCVVLSYRRPR